MAASMREILPFYSHDTKEKKKKQGKQNCEPRINQVFLAVALSQPVICFIPENATRHHTVSSTGGQEHYRFIEKKKCPIQLPWDFFLL